MQTAYFSSRQPVKQNTYIFTVNGRQIRVRLSFDALMAILPLLMAARGSGVISRRVAA